MSAGCSVICLPALLLANAPPHRLPCRYFFNVASGTRQYEHPMDEHYKKLVNVERAKLKLLRSEVGKLDSQLVDRRDSQGGPRTPRSSVQSQSNLSIGTDSPNPRAGATRQSASMRIRKLQSLHREEASSEPGVPPPQALASLP